MDNSYRAHRAGFKFQGQSLVPSSSTSEATEVSRIRFNLLCLIDLS